MDGTGHVKESLGLYYVDELDAASAQGLCAHLDACVTCRDEAAQVCESLAAMALLLDDREKLANMYGALGTSVPPAVAPAIAVAEAAAAPEMPEFSPEVRTKPVEGPAPSTVPALPHLAPQPGGETRPVRRT
ncbi:hypothetical protein [Micromonospora sp. WMMD1219]|uniref:hypothetical protein n=1 Tax=Micromonospora sp. WMMD1219 TaxID=3404115 RepID=UPI003BF5605F